MPTDLSDSGFTNDSSAVTYSEGLPILIKKPESSPSTISLSSPQDESEVEPHVLSSSTTCSSVNPAKFSNGRRRRSLEVLNGSIGSRRFGIEFTPEDVSFLPELGRGYGGIACKIQHKATGFLMVRKTFELDIKTSIRAQILRDLQILCECSSPFIPAYYGAFCVDKTISVCMEYMDAGGLDTLLPKVGRMPEPTVIRIAESVVGGLLYLWQELHIMHRNLKPSNILISRTGSVKLCDFVVSLPLADTVASAFVSTCVYLAPERLMGEPFNPCSDVWSLGLTLMELSIGCYPFPALDPVDFVRSFAPELEPNMEEHRRAARTGEPLPALAGSHSEQMNIFDLLTHIVERPPPRLAAYCFSDKFVHLIHSCLHKEPADRLSVEILHNHVLPPLVATTKTSELGDLSVLGYLNGMFSREQAEAIDAVVMAVGDELDPVDESMPNAVLSPWNLPSAGAHQLTTTTLSN